MSQSILAKVVTANDLRSGHVVWLTAAKDWSSALSDALVLTDATEAADVLSHAQARSAEVVGCYLADVRSTSAGPEPVHFRETFRRDGPSPAARIPAQG